jgi:hypothetical protein
MLIAVVRVLAVVSVAVYLVAAGAHLFELSGKLTMSPLEYMIVQGIYRSWAQFGTVIFAAMLLTLLAAVMRRDQRTVFILSLVSFVCLTGTQVVFWLFTYPMNAVSSYWTIPPEHFEAARRQWEYSHSVSAVLTFMSLLAIVSAVAVDASLVTPHGRRARGKPLIVISGIFEPD